MSPEKEIKLRTEKIRNKVIDMSKLSVDLFSNATHEKTLILTDEDILD